MGEERIWRRAERRELTDDEAAALGRFLLDLHRHGLGVAVDETLRATLARIEGRYE